MIEEEMDIQIEKTLLAMRLNSLQGVYRMLVHEQPVLTKEYVESEIEKAERRMDALTYYPEPAQEGVKGWEKQSI